MDAFTEKIPQVTLDLVARSFFKEMKKYGFKQVDYLRFVNVVLELSMHAEKIETHAKIKLA
jgi:hypothetical protein